MTITEFITELEKFRDQHGDLPVETELPFGRGPQPGPKLAYEKVLRGRETRERFWALTWEEKGKPLCRL